PSLSSSYLPFTASAPTETYTLSLHDALPISARLRRVVAARTHAVSCARSCAATANLVATAMPCLHHAITGMASELTRRDTRARQATVPWRKAVRFGSLRAAAVAAA